MKSFLLLQVALGALNVISGLGRWAERLSGRLQGRKEQQLEDAKEQLRQAQNANAIDEDVRRLSDSDLERELRGTRDR